MAKSSNRRRARAELERYVALATRFFKAGAHADAIAPLVEAARLAPNHGGILNDLGLAYLSSGHIPQAVTTLRRAVSLLPDTGRAHHNLGMALQEVGDDDAAIAAYRRAVAISPELAKAHGRLADLLWGKGLRSEAAVSYELASAAEPGTTFSRFCKAMALRASDRDREAEDELRQLIADDPGNSRAHALLGSILQETGRFDDAIATFEGSIALGPWEATAYYGLVCSRKLTEADRPWVTLILSRLEAEEWRRKFPPVVAERHRMTLHFAAGKALDDLGDPGAAMKHFDAANDIHRRIRPFDLAAVERLVERLIARYTPDFFAAHTALGGDDATPLLIVGMPRSGTTLLERILSSHPQVRGCGELDFWGERGPLWSVAELDELAKEAERLRSDYLGVLRRAAPDALRATDKMPFNFFWAGLLHVLFPNARFVHSTRNAIDTCLSIYATPLRATAGFASGKDNLASYYRLYLRLVEHWRAVLPADRWLEVDYEDVVARPEETARRLIAFSGLPWDPACLRPEENRDAVKTASHWQVRQPIYRTSVERWRRYEPWLGELAGLANQERK